jgi:hypothetical protein
MLRCEVSLTEVRLENGGWISGRMECPPGLRPAPGQYLLAQPLDRGPFGPPEPLPTVLFPARTYPLARSGEIAPGELELAPPLPAHWTAGTRLVVRGPLGRGFSLPPNARRVALVGLGPFAHRLLALAEQALVQGAGVAFYTPNARGLPAGLPPEVEIQSLESLGDALGWADYMAFDLLPGALPSLRKRFGLAPHTPLPVPAQVLVQVPMPCGGQAECGLCAVDQPRGWKMACKDGPVFDWHDLEDR